MFSEARAPFGAEAAAAASAANSLARVRARARARVQRRARVRDPPLVALPRLNANIKRNSPLYSLRPQIIIKLLEAYRENKCLWDDTHPNYRNNQARIQGWEKLLAILREQEPNAQLDTVKQRIFTIRTNYVRARRRFLYEETPNEPCMWYYNHLSFLDSQIKLRVRDSDSDDDYGQPSPNNNERTLNEDEMINNLVRNLPGDQKPAAYEFITKIMFMAKAKKMGFMKLSMQVEGADYTLIPPSEPQPQMPVLPSTSAEELQQQEIVKFEHDDVSFAEFAAFNPDCESISKEIIWDDSDD